MVIMDRKYLDQAGGLPTAHLLARCIELHQEQQRRLHTLHEYYMGNQAICGRELEEGIPNNKVVSNHAKYITDMAVGYVFGEPIIYGSADEDMAVDKLNDLYTDQDEDSHNSELANDISIYGHGLELIYMSEESMPELACLSPEESFIVCDTDIKHTPYMAFRMVNVVDIDGEEDGCEIDVWTDDKHILYRAASTSAIKDDEIAMVDEPEDHFFGSLPVIEYKNNKYSTGDFEPVLSLIDAYNLLMSDRVNDKEAFVDAILVVSGMSFGDDAREASETVSMLRQMRYLEIPTDGSAQWLNKTLSEADTEILKKALKDDIHEFSKVPCLTDENFASNASGVAMKYKLLGFEQLAQTKERYFKKGLRQRLSLMDGIMSIKTPGGTDFSRIDITMKRSLPVDDELKAKLAQETEGFLSWETRLSEYNPELDADAEKDRLMEEKKAAAEIQQQAFGGYTFPEPEEEPQNTEENGDE